MEKFRKTYIIRMVLLIILALFAIGINVYDVYFSGENIYESSIWAFQSGGAIGLGLVAMITVVKMRLTLPDGEKMEQLYNKENDERLKAIRAKSGMPMLYITSIAMIVAGIIAGYSNHTVFYTLVAAGAAQLLVGVVVKAINMKRM